MVNGRVPLILGLSLCLLFAPISYGLASDESVFQRPTAPAEGIARVSPFIEIPARAGKPGDGGIAVAQSTTPFSPGSTAGPEPFAAEEEDLPDVIEPLNRLFFRFNDRLYFWFLKPVARGYSAVVPEPARVGVRNFFHNLAFPIRFVNCLLQGKVVGAANEFGIFMVNSVFGIAGFLDVIPDEVKMQRRNEDLGQTLGSYGVGPGFYIVWPFLGPSTIRDSFGMVGDGFLNPLNYLVSDVWYHAGTRAYMTINETSLRIGEYEALKRAALDPYVALRNAYHQNRLSSIRE